MGSYAAFCDDSIMSIVRNISIYFIGSLLLKLASVFLVPALLGVLDVSSFGLLSLLMSFLGVISILLGCGLRQVFALDYFHLTWRERREMVNDLLAVFACAVAFTTIVVVFSFDFINGFFFKYEATQSMLALCLLYGCSALVTDFFYQILMYQKKAFLLVTLQLASVVVLCGSAWFFVWYLKFAVVGMLLAHWLSVSLSALVAGCLYLQRSLYNFFSLKRFFSVGFSYMLRGLPFIPSVFASWFLSSSNRWLLAHYGSLRDVAVYAVADLAGGLFQATILYPLGAAYVPLLFEKFAQHKQAAHSIDSLNKKIMVIAMIGLWIFFVVAYVLGRPVALFFLPQAYHAAIPYAFYLIASNVFLLGTYFTSAYVQFKKRTDMLVGSLIISSIISGISARLLVPILGLPGCIATLFIAYGFYFLLMFVCNSLVHRQK